MAEEMEEKRNDFWQQQFVDDLSCQKLANILYPPPGALVTAGVVCFPGSGSKWIMEMLQFATGFVTDM